MKKLLLLCFLGAGPGIQAQTTITSVSDGNASNPLTWDCLCFPTSSDNIIIDHYVTMDVDWIVNGSGSVTVSSGASFIEDANYRAILIDGAGTEMTNNGTTELTNVAVTGGAEVHNHGTFDLDSGLYIGPGSMYMNHATTINIDSVLNEGMFMNPGGSFISGDFYNTGTFSNAGYVTVDSLYNNGDMTVSDGYLMASDFATYNTFTLSGNGYVDIMNDMYNGGDLTIGTGRDIHVGNDFLNADSLGNSAYILNDGLLEVGNDFTNTDTLDGSGIFCIANNSTNAGIVMGTPDICDNTGTGFFDFNTGAIGSNVTDCTSGCVVGVDEIENLVINVYPNPAKNIITLDISGLYQYEIRNYTGQLVLNGSTSGSIDITGLTKGYYILSLIKAGTIVSSNKLIKK